MCLHYFLDGLEEWSQDFQPGHVSGLMDSNWIHGPSGQNGGATPKMVLEIGTVLIIADDSDFS
jgi:hypothetical protein